MHAEVSLSLTAISRFLMRIRWQKHAAIMQRKELNSQNVKVKMEDMIRLAISWIIKFVQIFGRLNLIRTVTDTIQQTEKNLFPVHTMFRLKRITGI